MNPVVVLAAMMALAQYSGDRADSAEQRRALYEPIAVAIASAAQTQEEEAALIGLGWHETKFARLVIEGKCEQMPAGQRCDNGRARGAFQLWPVACPRAYLHPAGSSESLRLEARCAIGNLRAARLRCVASPIGPIAGMFSGYRSSSCSWSPAVARVRTMNTVLSMLRKLG